MYSERLMEKIQEIVKKWSGKEGELNSLSIHDLICALNQDTYGEGEVYLVIKQALINKLIDLVQNVEKYPLKKELGSVYQIYLLIEPNFVNDMNRLFVISKRENKYFKEGYDYCLGVDYMPETGDWYHGHYDAETPKTWEKYIEKKYGVAIPLLNKEGGIN